MFTRLQPAPAAPASGTIRYISEAVPEFAVSPLTGERYRRLVPDTLDLQDRTALAVHGLTGPTDPDADYEIYWITFPRAKPPIMRHDWADACQAKFIEALPLMRIASGSDLNEHVERRWLETLFQMQGPDGLLYYPKHGRPWSERGIFGVPTPGDHYFTIYFGGRLLSAIALQYRRTGDATWRDAGRRFVQGLAGLVVKDGPYGTFAWPQYGPGGALPAGDTTVSPVYGMANWVAPVVAGLVQFWRATGDEDALDLAGRLARWIVDRSGHFLSDGAFAHEPHRPNAEIAAASGLEAEPAAHFHGHTITLLGVLEYAAATHDQAMMDFVVRGYEYGRAQGNTLLGYFPEAVGRSSFEDCESCCTADMVSLALKLSVAGAGDYWDDADRWIRNQLVENQLTRADWTWRLWEVGSAHPRDFDLRPSVVDATDETTDRTMERNLGGFASHATANDFTNGRTGITACCTGNGARSLYYAWEHTLTRTDDALRVNLLLNRASPWADVASHLPYEGRVDVAVKVDMALSIRLPEWVAPADVHAVVAGAPTTLRWDGRVADLGRVTAGREVTLTFPIEERTIQTYVQKHAFAITRRGNDVVAIDPPGRYAPLYQRDQYRRLETRWREIERYVDPNPIDW